MAASTEPEGGLAPGRSCGTCVACCKVMSIDVPSLQKPAGVLCQHCTGSGCGIYARRPEPCQTYYCLWRRVPTMPDELRPDKAGVIFTIEEMAEPRNPFERAFVIARVVDGPEALDNPITQMALQTFMQRGDLPIWISVGQERRLFHPRAELRDAILSAAAPPAHLAADVQLWRQRLGLQ